jgi:hypothetical protein
MERAKVIIAALVVTFAGCGAEPPTGVRSFAASAGYNTSNASWCPAGYVGIYGGQMPNCTGSRPAACVTADSGECFDLDTLDYPWDTTLPKWSGGTIQNLSDWSHMNRWYPMQQGNQAGVFIDSWGVQWAWAAGWGCTGAFSEYRKICFN